MDISAHHVLLFIVISAALITDIKSMKIPNLLTVSGLLIGLTYHTVEGGWKGLKFSVVAALVGLGVVLLLHFIGAVGAGDVKLFAAIGALSSTTFVLTCLMYSILYAGGIGLLVLLTRRKLFNDVLRFFYHVLSLFWLKDLKALRTVKEQASLRFPFMYAVYPATITSWYLVVY